MRTSPQNITELKENEIFVFGSNEAGRHGAGAAKQALKWGAVYGQAEGIQGQTYAIPTKNKWVCNTLSIEEITVYVNRFLRFAYRNPKLNFLVTEIGCGLAGLTPEQVAPLFEDAIELENVYLPERFINIIKTLIK